MKSCLALLLVILAGMLNASGQITCSICRTGNFNEIYAVRGLGKDPKLVCDKCLRSVSRCVICRLPVAGNDRKQLEDGRVFCHADYAAGIFDAREIERILYETKREMTRVFWKHMSFPEKNIPIAVVDGRELHRLYGTPYDPVTSTLQGLTQTSAKIIQEDGTERKVFEHKIYLLSGLPKPRLMAVCAHEFAHVWLNENLKPGRRIDHNTVEGFCELVAYQLMDSLSASFEKSVIEANAYSDDQALTFIEGEKQYGLYKIIQWMLHGTDQRISKSDLDRIRVVEEPRVTQPKAILSYQPVAPLPAALELKGISGVGQRRFALINNKTLAANEKAKIQLASTNVMIRCLEIREKSAVIEINESEKQELFLAPVR